MWQRVHLSMQNLSLRYRSMLLVAYVKQLTNNIDI